MPVVDKLSTPIRRLRGNPEARVAIFRMLLLIGARVGGTVLTLAYTLLLSRVASQHDFGVAMAAMSVSLLASVPMSMNVEMGSVRYLSKYAAEKQDALAAGFIRFVVHVIVLMTGLMVLIGGGYLLGANNTGQELWAYAIALSAAPIIAMSRLSSKNAVVFDAVLSGTLPRMLVRPLLFIVFVGGAFIVGASMSAISIVLMYLASAIVAYAMQYVLLRKYFQKYLAVAPDYSEKWQWLKTGVMLSPLLVMNEFLRDVIITSASVSLAKDQVALLVIAISLIGVLSFAVTSVDIALTSRVAQALMNSATERARKLMAMAASLKCLAVLIVGTCVVLLRDPILSLLGDDYVAAGSGLVMLMAMPASSAILGPGDMVLTVLGHRKYVLIASLCGLVATATLTIGGGLLGGFRWAAAGAAIASVLQQALLYAFCRLHTDVDPSIMALRYAHRDRA